MRMPRSSGAGTRVLAASAGAFGSLDTALNIAFPDLVADFDLSVGQLRWVVICFVLASGGLLLPAGALGDALGHRRMVLAGATLSTVAMAGCALAPTFEWFLVARAVQGVGTAALMASAPALVTLAAPPALRRQAIGLFQAATAMGLASGPVIGAVMVAAWSWRAVFWFRVPLAIALLLLAAAVGSSRGHSIGRSATATATGSRAVDRRGAVLVSVVLLGTLAAINSGALGWSVVVLFALFTGVAGVALVRHSLAHPAPILDVRLFARPGFAVANALTFFANGSMFATWLLIPILLVDRLNASLLVSGTVLATSPAATAVAAAVVGRRTRSGRAPRSMGTTGPLLIMALGMGVLSMADVGWSPIAVGVGLAMVGAGLGLFSVPNMAVVMVALPESEQGVAGALSLMMRTLGIVAGVALQGDLFDRVADVDGFAVAYRQVFLVATMVLVIALALTLASGWRQRTQT